MFKCERCGSGYSANHIGVENCPRCLLLDRVQTPLAFKMFEVRSPERKAPQAQTAPPAQEREESVLH